MRLKTAISNGFSVPTGNNFYNSKGWFLLIKNDIDRMLRINYGMREVFDSYLKKDGSWDPANTQRDMQDTVDLMLMANTWKYDHMFSIYEAEYNPIWNYEGTEERETHRTLNDTASGQDSVASTGDDTTKYQGAQKDTNSGSIQESRTSYDSSTAYDTNKTTDTTSTERTFTNRQDVLTHGKTDTTTFGKVSDVSEDISEKMTRGGNMGTVSTQNMMIQEIDVAGRLNLMQRIAIDIVNTICYS